MRVLPLSPVVCVFFLQTATLLRSCLWVVDGSALVFVVQDSLYGPVMPAALAPLHMPSGSLVCNFSPSWRCTVGGSWKKTAAIWKPSCSGSTLRPSSSRMSSVVLFCTWFGTMVAGCQRCRHEYIAKSRMRSSKTPSMPCMSSWPQLTLRFAIFSHRCLQLWVTLDNS